ncbi:DNA repair protein XRCC4 [Magnolia sinica]|uniref:DNA repair protein XRCC4 n=1 Tax=Magnolia sinica TaxID=86752 RepID=UPI002657CA16|nr:DNA repair protein XRCC4 [Magnolia sinica]
MDSTTRHTCLRLEIEGEEGKGKTVIFVKGTWFASHFNLSITDGFNAWTCNASESEISERADQWDQPVTEYIEAAERYLGYQQPGSVYQFVDAGNGNRRLSWTFVKEGVKLEGRWRCQASSDSKKTTAEILDFLMDANIRLSEEVVSKTQSFKRLKTEAEKCLAQSEKFKDEKAEFESAVYAKFVGVLNSKKAKLRELRDQLSKLKTGGKLPQEEDESTDRTEMYDEESDDAESKEQTVKKDLPSASKNTTTMMSKGQKRKTRI